MRSIVRSLVVPSVLILMLSASSAYAQKGGGGGGGVPTNPLVGNWIGRIGMAGTFDIFEYDFTFTKDFQFILTFSDLTTGASVTHTGTYILGALGPDGFFPLTFFSQGQVFLQEEWVGSNRVSSLRGDLNLLIKKL